MVYEWYLLKLEALKCVLGYLGYQSLQYGAIVLFWQNPEKPNFFHLTLLRHQNIKMFIYKLDKHDWGNAISVFIVPVRNE